MSYSVRFGCLHLIVNCGLGFEGLFKDVAGCSLVMKVEEEQMSTLPATGVIENLLRPAREINEFEEEVATEKSSVKHIQLSRTLSFVT